MPPDFPLSPLNSYSQFYFGALCPLIVAQELVFISFPSPVFTALSLAEVTRRHGVSY